MKLTTIAIVAFAAVTSAAVADIHPLSEEYIASINEKAKTWKAGKNFQIEDWERVKKIASGLLPTDPEIMSLYKSNPHDESEDVPGYYDARQFFAKCDSIKQIRDQSNCGSCWAFAAVEAMSDRICIHSGETKQVYVSAEDLASCCYGSEFGCGYGCNGGNLNGGWEYWKTYGIVSGGLYNSSQGCKDYSLEPCEHYVDDDSRPQCSSLTVDTPACVKTCYDASLNYEDSLSFGQEVHTFTTPKQIQLEISKNGPVESGFTVYEDFLSYKSGVYQATSTKALGGHAIKIIGWGVENDTPYWLVANSWNTDWGDNGFFKILRGENHCSIESAVVASLPVL